MTVEEIRERVQQIEEYARRQSNDEAHVDEDDLYLDTLRAIAEGASNARELAREALKANRLGYERWYD